MFYFGDNDVQKFSKLKLVQTYLRHWEM